MQNILKVLAAAFLLLVAGAAVPADTGDLALAAPVAPAAAAPIASPGSAPPALAPLIAPMPGLSPAPISATTFTPKFTAGGLARRPAVQLKSRSVLVVRADNGEVLYRKNIDRELPIASITKLMTAMVVIDAGQSLDELLTITDGDVDTLKNTHSRLAVGTRLTRAELLLLALMSSENRAASALATHYPGGREAAIAAMNRKAAAIGMSHSRFSDPTGLSSANKASVIDLVRLVKAAEDYELIRGYSTTPQYTLSIGHRAQTFRNTNPLVKSPEWSIDLTKTGFINEAGRCLVMKARIAEMPVILVLMDSSGKMTRIGDANRVRQWIESTLTLAGNHSGNGA